MCLKYLFFITLISNNLFAQTKNFGYINPVIAGMNPDPSVCRVGEDYYAVTSTFQWFPGVPVYHSKDLVHWELIGYSLHMKSQLNLEKGSGIYAPVIRYNNGVFYMVTTNRRNGENFYVTAKNPAGPWSNPVWVSQEGIDPSLMFDEDGKVYFTCTHPDGILQREIDIGSGTFLTEPKIIWSGTGGRYPEGPHLYKISNVYYLMISEGGTEYGHQVVIARSNNPWGPFENNPDNPILTHRNKNAQSNIIQGVGHADLVQAHDGSWWTLFLGFRQKGSHHHTGRETFLAPVAWLGNGWPLINSTGTVELKMNVATLLQYKYPSVDKRCAFDAEALPLEWNFIKNPDSSAYSLTNRKGWLRLKGGSGTLVDNKQVTFTGKRQTDLVFSAETLLDFNPSGQNEEAGLSVYHRNNGHYDLFVRKEKNERFIVLRYTIGSLIHEQQKIKLTNGSVFLRAEGIAEKYNFSFSQDGKQYRNMGNMDSRLISSETLGGFVGVYIGLYATGNGKHSLSNADFDWFEYEGKDK